MSKTRKAPPLRNRLEIRVTTSLLRLLREAAERDKRTVSEWARLRLETEARKEVQA